MERLILCGAGHISQQIARMAQYLDFELAVIDDRAEFANTERFPMPCQLLCMPFLAALERLGSESSDYYVIVTRGHTFDQDCLEYILRGRYAYVGMIGSRGKVAATMDALKKAGFSQKELNGVHAPLAWRSGRRRRRKLRSPSWPSWCRPARSWDRARSSPRLSPAFCAPL